MIERSKITLVSRRDLWMCMVLRLGEDIGKDDLILQIA